MSITENDRLTEPFATDRVLSVVEVQKIKKPGMYADGGGLYLSVGITGAKSWIFRFMLRGKARAMGLGSVRFVSLAEARDKPGSAVN